MPHFIAPYFITPHWPAPRNVKALQTTRLGGGSLPPYDALNLGEHVGDSPQRVAQNRALLAQYLPNSPLWLSQVHGTRVLDANLSQSSQRSQRSQQADASFTQQRHQVCCVMTADCLPLLFCNEAGTQVAAAHAGWRGLLNGILENTLASFNDGPESIFVWLGPAIGPAHFEVGQEVYAAFCGQQPAAKVAFTEGSQQGKWLADLYVLARLRLQRCGITNIYGGELCTFSDEARFFSYRRDGVCGRQASCIWLE